VLAEAASAIREGLYDAAVCGACDSRITPLGLVRSLASGLAARAESASDSRPFDKSRHGFIVSEGAAFFVIEELESARKRGATIHCEIAGSGESCDAYHPTLAHPDGRGLVHSMSVAIARAGWSANEVDLVVACSSSMPDLDSAEAVAISRVFADASPLVTAPSSLFGRAHAAASALAVATAAVAIDHAFVPPTINTDVPMDGAPRGLVLGDSVERNVRSAIVNGYAIGGQCATLAIRGMA
jgi:3-oxoacyl-[acyl-carrier-protein] synthase II